MKIELQKFNGYVAQFLRSVLAPAAKSRATQFKIGWALGSGKAAVAKDDDRFKMFVATGVMDKDGVVDVDQLRKCVEGGLELSGTLRIDELGVDVERPEIDRFFRLLETGALT